MTPRKRNPPGQTAESTGGGITDRQSLPDSARFANPLPPNLAHLFEQAPRECLVCGPSDVLAFGLFIPKDSQDFGAPAGKQRYFGYWACGCLGEQDTADLVERLLLEAHGSGKGDA
ncbi:MAG: hypothetical protein IT186_15925 [Acidobacteria bacterium]|nr:hypothetical protein [Acidobacteriota bacterium]